MSFQAVGWVLDHSPTELAERLVLLSIAHHADSEPRNGAWEAYPGTATIQREAGIRRSNTVNEVVQRLVTKGLLDRVINGAPDERLPKNRRPNLYRIPLTGGAPCRSRCCLCALPVDGAPTTVCPPGTARPDPPVGGDQITIEQSLTVETPSVSPPAAPHIVALCNDLADSIAAHREGPKPKVTKRWLRDMRLLVERGPLHVEDPKPIEPHRVATAIRFVFTELAEPTGRDGFCWADQIRSAHALRDHWEQLADAARRLVRQRRRDPLAPAVSTSADPLAGPPLRLGAP